MSLKSSSSSAPHRSLPSATDQVCRRPCSPALCLLFLFSLTHITFLQYFSILLVPNPSCLHLACPPYVLAYLLRKSLTPPPNLNSSSPMASLIQEAARCLSEHKHPQMWETRENRNSEHKPQRLSVFLQLLLCFQVCGEGVACDPVSWRHCL